MSAGFREAYQRMRHSYIFDCRKHGLSEDPEAFADEKINELSTAQLLNELESFANIVDDERKAKEDVAAKRK